jgi:hypothetical protein
MPAAPKLLRENPSGLSAQKAAVSRASPNDRALLANAQKAKTKNVNDEERGEDICDPAVKLTTAFGNDAGPQTPEVKVADADIGRQVGETPPKQVEAGKGDAGPSPDHPNGKIEGVDAKTPNEVPDSWLTRAKKLMPDAQTLFGLSILALTIYSGIKAAETTDVTVQITEIQLVIDSSGSSSSSGSKIVNVSYSTDSTMFDPCVGDYVVFHGAPAPIENGGFTIVAVTGTTTIQIQLPATIQGFTSSGSSGATTVTSLSGSGLGSFTCQSSFENQFVSTVGGLTGSMINAAADGANQAISAGAGVADNAANTLKNTFCKTAGFLCNVTTWIIFAVVIFICIILFITIN